MWPIEWHHHYFIGPKLAKLDYLPLFVALVFRKQLQYRRSDF